jgi:hypothetical protein
MDGVWAPHRIENRTKSQYYGDINDYRKYGLLRIRSGVGALRTAACWRLTEDDLQVWR